MTNATRHRLIRASIWTVSIVVIFGAAVAGPKVTISQQWPLFDELREVAAIIFGLIGVWMALVYPKAFAQAFKPGAETDHPGFKRLIRPFWWTAGIVAFVMVYGVVRAGLNAFIGILWPYHPWFRAASFILLCALVLVQLWVLLLAASPIDDLQDELQDAAAARDQLDQLRRLRKRG